MVKTGKVENLLGGLPSEEVEGACLQFWKHYSAEFPTHQIFEASRQGKASLSRTIPTYLFGDEGRWLKKTGVMCVTLQGLIGRGSNHYFSKGQKADKKRQLLNLSGSSFLSRLLLAAMPKKFYEKRPAVYRELFSAIVDDLVQLQDDGFEWNGRTWHIQVLGLKGDLPYLTKTASLERHYLRAAKKEVTAHSRDPPGMCFLCPAGQRDHPFEDVNEDASWYLAGPCPPPWSTPPSFLKLRHVAEAPEQFLKTDLFHNFHGGLGKDFIASSLAEVLVLLMGPGSLEHKCSELDGLLRAWASKPGRNLPHSGGFCKERISMTSYQVCPDAAWGKHADTTVYCKFLEFLLQERAEEVERHRTLQLIFDACRAINACMSLLYSSGLWLTKAEAAEAGKKGRLFVCMYATLAWECFSRRSLRFPMHSKIHMIDHTMRWLCKRSASPTAAFVLNPICESNSQDEDARPGFCETFVVLFCSSLLSSGDIKTMALPKCTAGFYWTHRPDYPAKQSCHQCLTGIATVPL